MVGMRNAKIIFVEDMKITSMRERAIARRTDKMPFINFFQFQIISIFPMDAIYSRCVISLSGHKKIN